MIVNCDLSRREMDQSQWAGTPGVASHSAAKDFVHIYGRGWATRGEPDD